VFFLFFWSGLGTFAPLRVACNPRATATTKLIWQPGSGGVPKGVRGEGAQGGDQSWHSGGHNHKQSGVGSFCGRNAGCGVIPN